MWTFHAAGEAAVIEFHLLCFNKMQRGAGCAALPSAGQFLGSMRRTYEPYQDAARRRHSLILLLVSWALLESQLQSCWGIHQNKSPEITKIRWKTSKNAEISEIRKNCGCWLKHLISLLFLLSFCWILQFSKLFKLIILTSLIKQIHAWYTEEDIFSVYAFMCFSNP